MNIKSILTTFIILVIIVAGVLFISKKAKTNKLSVPSTTPDIEQQIKTKFNGLIIPDDVEKADLKNVSGGEGMGIATRSEIFADLPELPSGKYYRAWLSNGTKELLLGSLKQAKGGYILDYNSINLSDYNKVIVTVDGTHILEGSF